MGKGLRVTAVGAALVMSGLLIPGAVASAGSSDDRNVRGWTMQFEVEFSPPDYTDFGEPGFSSPDVLTFHDTLLQDGEPVGHEVGPVGPARVVERRGDDLEVLGAVRVGADVEPVAPVLDVVDQQRLARLHQAQGGRRRVPVEQLVEQQKAEYERRDKEKAQEGAGGAGKKCPGRGGRRGKAKKRQGDRPPRGRDKDEDDDDDEDMDDDETDEQEFQKATEVLCVDGGTSLHTSHRQLKQWVREVNAAEPPVESRKPLKWSSTPIIFDIEDHPDRITTVGCLPMLVSPTIRNLKVTKMLVDGGSGLNLISSAVLQKLQIPDSELEETGTFQGINPEGASRRERSRCR